MADVNLPQINQLGSMFQMNPLAFQQAQNQIDLGNQFAKQNLDQGEQDLQTKTLNNLFQVQNDPLKLQKAKQENEGTGYDNIIKKIDAEQRATLAPEELEAKRAKMVKEWSSSKLEKAMNDAQEMMWSDDPALQAKGKSLYANSFKELHERNKHKDEMEKVTAQRDSAERIAAGNNKTSVDVANIYANQRGEAAKLRAGGVADFETLLARYGKTYEARQGLYEQKAMQAERAGDADEAAYYRGVAERERIQNERKIQGTTDARLGAQPSIPGITKGKIPERGSQLPSVPGMPSRGVSGPVSEGAPTGAFDLGPNQERLPGIRDFISKMPKGPDRSNAEAALAEQLSRGKTPAQPKPAAEQKPMLADVQKMYPGIPAAKLKEAYKKKFGVDLQ